MTKQLQAALRAMPSRHQVTRDYPKACGVFHMRINVHLMLDSETEESLNAQVSLYDHGKKVIDAYVASSKEAARELKNAVRNAKKSVERTAEAAKQAQVAADQRRLQEQTSKARQAVKDIEGASPALFTLEVDIPKCPEFEEAVAVNLELPVVFRAPQDMEPFLQIPKIQLMLGNFGGSYKKAKGFKESGFYQQPSYKATE